MSRIRIVEPRREHVSRQRVVKVGDAPKPQCDAVAVARRHLAGVDYVVMSNGQMIRHAPLKPWNSKAERKQVLKQRRKERSAA